MFLDFYRRVRSLLAEIAYIKFQLRNGYSLRLRIIKLSVVNREIE